MRAFWGVVRKEFLQFRRDHNMVRMFFVVPLVQLFILGYAVNLDVRRIRLDVYDFSRGPASRELIEQFGAAGYFVPHDMTSSDAAGGGRQGGGPFAAGFVLWDIERRFQAGRTDMALTIPPGFERDLSAGRPVTLGLAADGTDANTAATGLGYAGRIVAAYGLRGTAVSAAVQGSGGASRPGITLRADYLFNPEAESRRFMIPGIVATLLTMLTLMATAMAVVRERELGTLEQVLVTPMGAFPLLAGKVCAYGTIATTTLALTLGAGLLWFRIPVAGSIPLLAALSVFYVFSSLGLGLLISTVSSSQQQAMFLAWFFSVFTMLTSGYMTPIANMPEWLQRITVVNPMRYYIEFVRGIILRGAGVAELQGGMMALALFTLIVYAAAFLRFRSRLR